jgi:hypothetical protein
MLGASREVAETFREVLFGSKATPGKDGMPFAALNCVLSSPQSWLSNPSFGFLSKFLF